jgi:hypothetical protein
MRREQNYYSAFKDLMLMSYSSYTIMLSIYKIHTLAAVFFMI